MNWKKLQEALDTEIAQAMQHTHKLHRDGQSRKEMVMFGNVMLLAALARALAAGLKDEEARSAPPEPGSLPEPGTPRPH